MALNAGNEIENKASGIVVKGTAVEGGYFVTESLANIPSYANKKGQLCYCTGTDGEPINKFYIYNGTGWEEKNFGITTDATETAAGLMSAEDKKKLAGIEDGANKTIVDTALSESSTNPVQNKIVKEALDTKLDSSDISDWALESTKPSYTAEEVGALPNGTTLADLQGDATHRVVTDDEKAAWNAKSNFSGNYSDLVGIPITFEPSEHEHAYIPTSEKGEANGIATLDASGKIHIEQLNIDGELSEASINPVQNKVVKNAIDSIQNQINTIMDNPDTEGIINSINEFTTYINEHGDVAEGFRTDINNNKIDIDQLKNNAIQNISTPSTEATDGTTIPNGLKATVAGTNVEISIDDTLTWVFSGGSSADHLPPPVEVSLTTKDYYTTAPDEFWFIIQGNLKEDFIDIQVDGVVIDASNYVISGDYFGRLTDVYINMAYLATLATGSHELAINFETKVAKGTFTVTAPALNINNYGFYYNWPYLASSISKIMILYEDSTLEIIDLPSGTRNYADYSVGVPTAGKNPGDISTDLTIHLSNSGETFTAHTKYTQEGIGISTGATPSFNGMPAYFNAAFNDSEVNYAVDENCLYIYKEDLPVLNGDGTTELVRGYSVISNIISKAHFMPRNVELRSNIKNYNVRAINDRAFYECDRLAEITIPIDILSIGAEAFAGCTSLSRINYKGSTADWNLVNKGTDWCAGASTYEVQCTDGTCVIY